jgi:hypothetical protein
MQITSYVRSAKIPSNHCSTTSSRYGEGNYVKGVATPTNSGHSILKLCLRWSTTPSIRHYLTSVVPLCCLSCFSSCSRPQFKNDLSQREQLITLTQVLEHIQPQIDISEEGGMYGH